MLKRAAYDPFPVPWKNRVHYWASEIWDRRKIPSAKLKSEITEWVCCEPRTKHRVSEAADVSGCIGRYLPANDALETHHCNVLPLKWTESSLVITVAKFIYLLNLFYLGQANIVHCISNGLNRAGSALCFSEVAIIVLHSNQLDYKDTWKQHRMCIMQLLAEKMRREGEECSRTMLIPLPVYRVRNKAKEVHCIHHMPNAVELNTRLEYSFHICPA